MTAGANGLAAFTGDISYKGSLTGVDGRVKLAAQNSRLGTTTAERTRLGGAYHLGIKGGTFALVGDFATDNTTLDPKVLDGVIQPLSAAASTPIGPIAASISNAIGRTASRFNTAGHIRIVNFPGGGAARITDADINGPSGARARVFGGSGVTYYWPKGNLRIDGNIEMGGGGLPHGRVTLRQPFSGAPMSGVATIDPYAAGGQRLALSPIRFGPGRAIRPRSAPRRSSMAASRAAGSRRCGCRYRVASARAAGSLSVPRARSSASIASR